MYFVYILSNWDDSVLYIGVTSNLPKRLYEHRNHITDGLRKSTMYTSWSILKNQQMYRVLLLEKSS